MAVGYFLYIVLLVLHNINSVTTLRLMKDIWTDTYISVTLLAVLSSVVMAVSTYALFFEERKSMKLLGCGGLATVLALNFRTATRTPFVLLVLIIMLALYLQEKMADSKKRVRFFIRIMQMKHILTEYP